MNAQVLENDNESRENIHHDYKNPSPTQSNSTNAYNSGTIHSPLLSAAPKTHPFHENNDFVQYHLGITVCGKRQKLSLLGMFQHDLRILSSFGAQRHSRLSTHRLLIIHNERRYWVSGNHGTRQLESQQLLTWALMTTIRGQNSPSSVQSGQA